MNLNNLVSPFQNNHNEEPFSVLTVKALCDDFKIHGFATTTILFLYGEQIIMVWFSAKCIPKAYLGRSFRVYKLISGPLFQPVPGAPRINRSVLA